jgi:hypothetical protein
MPKWKRYKAAASNPGPQITRRLTGAVRSLLTPTVPLAETVSAGLIFVPATRVSGLALAIAATPGQVGHQVRPAGMIAFGAQVDRRGLAGVQVGQPVGALADPADLIDQAVADQVTPVQFGIVIPAGVFRDQFLAYGDRAAITGWRVG